MAATDLLRVDGVCVSYPGVEAVRRATLAVGERQIVGLVGPSGCGKTTLLRTIAGFEKPDAGRVEFAGAVVVEAAGRDAGAGNGSARAYRLEAWIPPERRNIGMVFQEGALFPHLTVFDNVGYGIRRRADREARIREVLALVALDGHADRFPDQLSGGQRQRVALARALAPRPKLVLLDEPFASLDASLRERVRDEVRTILEKAELSAILVTHDQEEALSFSDVVAVMMAGRIVQTGAPEAVYHHPVSAEVAGFLGEGSLLECEVVSGRFRSVFGEATCEAPDGDGVVFVRPEDFIVHRWSQGGGIAGTVVDRRFFGHDVLDLVELANGERVEVRSLSSATLPVGSPVRLELRERAYHVFAGPQQALNP